LLPASTIQTIVEDIETIYDFSQDFTLGKLRESLTKLNVPVNDIDAVIVDLKSTDIFRSSVKGELRSHKTRQTFFKKRFNYVSPQQVYLGRDKFNNARFMYYVPIKENLLAMFKDTSVQKMYQKTHSKLSTPGVLSDISDGNTFKRSEFFSANSSALRIILYQDAFEVVNPLGSGRRKHKVLAVYFSLADLLPYARSMVTLSYKKIITLIL